MEDNCFTMFCWFLPYSKVNLPRVLVAQLCLTLCDPMHCSPPGSSVHGILQTRMLEWVAIPSSRGSSQPRNRTQVSCVAGRHFTSEPPGKTMNQKDLPYGLAILLVCTYPKEVKKQVYEYS